MAVSRHLIRQQGCRGGGGRIAAAGRMPRCRGPSRSPTRTQGFGVCGQAASPARQREEKLLRAYHADAIDVATLKREQARINAEVAQAESQLANDGEKLAQAKKIIDLALDLAKNCAASYRKANPDVRKAWNRAFFPTILVRNGAIADFTYEEPFASLLGSHNGSMVDPRGFEPLTFWLPARRSTS